MLFEIYACNSVLNMATVVVSNGCFHKRIQS